MIPPSQSHDSFVVVRHSILNGNAYSVDEHVEDMLKLEQHTNGRLVLPCFEGDLLQVEGTGEIVLTHRNFKPLVQKEFRDLRDQHIAASLDEALDKINNFHARNSEMPIVLCLELKAITSKATVYETVRRLHQDGIHHAYFDSFFGRKLDEVAAANRKYGTAYGRSLHLCGNIGRLHFAVAPRPQRYDMLTVPKATSFGNPGEPVIYGAVGSRSVLGRIAERPDVIGAYVRLHEGAGVLGAAKMLMNSMSNTRQLRDKTVVRRYATV